MVSEHRIGGAPKAVAVLLCEPIPSYFSILAPLGERFIGFVADLRGRCDVTACVVLRYPICFIVLAMTLCTTSPDIPFLHALRYSHCIASFSLTVAYIPTYMSTRRTCGCSMMRYVFDRGEPIALHCTVHPIASRFRRSRSAAFFLFSSQSH